MQVAPLVVLLALGQRASWGILHAQHVKLAVIARQGGRTRSSGWSLVLSGR
jgi:hypothetical protein